MELMIIFGAEVIFELRWTPKNPIWTLNSPIRCLSESIGVQKLQFAVYPSLLESENSEWTTKLQITSEWTWCRLCKNTSAPENHHQLCINSKSSKLEFSESKNPENSKNVKILITLKCQERNNFKERNIFLFSTIIPRSHFLNRTL